MSFAIEAQGLTKTFGRGAKALTAVKGIDLQIEKGEVFGFLGPNGAGKTSTIRMLTGIARPTKGTVQILGEEISPDKLTAKHKIGYMPELPGFYPALKAIDHLLYWADFFHIPRGEARKRSLELLDKVGLRDHGERKAKDFSHGMKKRLALAGALINDPEVLILDEPSGGLDPEGTYFFRRLIDDEKKRGRTIFLSSHLLPEIQLISTRVGVLHRGKLVAVDTVKELERKVSRSAPVRIHVNCPPLTPDQVKAALAVPGVLGFEPQPSGIVVVAAAGTALGYPLNRALIDANVQVDSLYPLIPSLEEVFLKLVEGSEHGGTP